MTQGDSRVGGDPRRLRPTPVGHVVAPVIVGVLRCREPDGREREQGKGAHGDRPHPVAVGDVGGYDDRDSQFVRERLARASRIGQNQPANNGTVSATRAAAQNRARAAPGGSAPRTRSARRPSIVLPNVRPVRPCQNPTCHTATAAPATIRVGRCTQRLSSAAAEVTEERGRGGRRPAHIDEVGQCPSSITREVLGRNGFGSGLGVGGFVGEGGLDRGVGLGFVVRVVLMGRTPSSLSSTVPRRVRPLPRAGRFVARLRPAEFDTLDLAATSTCAVPSLLRRSNPAAVISAVVTTFAFCTASVKGCACGANSSRATRRSRRGCAVHRWSRS